MSIDNKVFPIFEGPQLRRRFTTEGEWKDWLRTHGAYGFRVAPYYSRCVVVFGADRYIETMKQLYGVDDSEFIDDAGGWVTDMGYFDADRFVHGVFLPDYRDEKTLWHEALHVAMTTAEQHGVRLSDQEAITYLQGYIAEKLDSAFCQFKADKKAGGLPPIGSIVTRDPLSIRRGGYGSVKKVAKR
ncbi:TPA: hypothetical protein ACJI3N_005321 [Raoultella planticola]